MHSVVQTDTTLSPHEPQLGRGSVFPRDWMRLGWCGSAVMRKSQKGKGKGARLLPCWVLVISLVRKMLPTSEMTKPRSERLRDSLVSKWQLLDLNSSQAGLEVSALLIELLFEGTQRENEFECLCMWPGLRSAQRSQTHTQQPALFA